MDSQDLLKQPDFYDSHWTEMFPCNGEKMPKQKKQDTTCDIPQLNFKS